MIAVEIEPYIVRWPYVSNQIGEQPDGNAILYQGVYFAIKRRYSNLTQDDANWTKATHIDARHSEGVLTRGSHKKLDWQSFDDYIGMIYSSHITGAFQAALDIHKHGEENNWCFDNVGLPWYEFFKKWFGRIPGFVALSKMSVRKKLNLFDQWFFSLALLGNDTESGFQKSWLMYDLYKTQPYQYNIIDKACKKFEIEVSEKYPNKMGDVFRIYYGPNHVFTKWMMGRM